jgi:hypothetical protein
MKGFKGFNKDLKCRGEQYAIGETKTFSGTPQLGSRGLHFCEHPLDTWSSYAPNAGSRYAEIEADGVTEQREKDSKRVGSSLTVEAEIKIPALLKAAIKFVFDKISPTTGYSAHSATTGDSAHSATTGNYAHSATTGDYAHSATTGDYAHSATTGDYAHSATTGYYAHSATTGDYAHSATTGNYAQSSVGGKGVIAASLGREGQAKAAKGSWLVLAEYKIDGTVKSIGVAWVDGKKIEADTFYTLKGKKFVKVQP